MNKHKTRTEWELLVNKFVTRTSNETIKSYCLNNNINFKTFQNWLYKSKIKTTKIIAPKKNKSNFIQFRLPTASTTMTIKLLNGITIEFISNNLSSTIKELIHVV